MYYHSYFYIWNYSGGVSGVLAFLICADWSPRRIWKVRKLLGTHVLDDEVRFRGHGIQIESEHSDISRHVPALPSF